MASTYLIGNAHLDPVWLWRWQDGFSEILATYRSALDRLYEFPQARFTSACAVYYEWIEKIDPHMFEEIRTMVKAGRWNIVGGWFLQPDCNLPDGESYMRHALIAQRYFYEKFGVTAKTGYNVDSFGHNASLPKILHAAGMENYVFMRPSPEEQGRNETLFRWRSDDGSELCAYRIPQRYNIATECLNVLEAIIRKSEEENRDLMAFYGVGNHGGGPTVSLLNTLQVYGAEGAIHSTPDAYFAGVDKASLPVIDGELQHHARGCYSAEAHIKQRHRRCEQNLLAAEKLCVMAQQLTGAKYPARKLEKAWKNLLFNQFHDILGGCSIRKAYEDADHLFGEIMSITEQEMQSAMQRIAWNVDTLRGETLPAYKLNSHENSHWVLWEHEVLGTPVVVFNPHPWEVTLPVSVYATASKMTDVHGAEIPFQIVRGDQTNGEDKYHTAFSATVPAMGYTVYRLFTETPSETVPETTLTVNDTSLENQWVRLELDPDSGDIRRLWDKQRQRYVSDHPCKAVLLDETACDTWAHGQRQLGDTVGAFTANSFEVVECGPVRAAVKVRSHYGHSTLERIYSLTSDSPVVRVDVKVDFHERHKALKFTFPLTDRTVTAKIPYGTVRRQGYRGEEPCGSFLVSGDLAVANDGKYGYDTEDGELRMTVLRGAIYADHYGQRDDHCEYMDQGEHTFSYSVFPFESLSQCEKRAAELNFGLRRVLDTFHKGTLPEEQSCVELRQENVVLSAVKQAADGNGIVFRLYELEGRPTTASIRLFQKEIETKIAPYQIKTVDDGGRILNAMEWEVPV